MSLFNIASLQLPTHLRYQENFDRLSEHLKLHQDKNLIVAPEVCLTGFDYKHLQTAAKFSVNVLKQLKKEVDEQIVIFTLILQEEEGFINQAVVLHKHKIIHKQNKVKLFRLGKEHSYFKAGEQKQIKAFEVDGVKYAILICFELRFKELWKQIEGVDVVIVPARWGKERKKHLQILSQALALMNQCYVVVSNALDEDMAGASAIISPSGEATDDNTLEVIEGMIDLKEIKKMRRYIVMD